MSADQINTIEPGSVVFAVVDPNFNSGERFAPCLVVAVGEHGGGTDGAVDSGVECDVVVFTKIETGLTSTKLATLEVYPDRATAQAWGVISTNDDPIAASRI